MHVEHDIVPVIFSPPFCNFSVRSRFHGLKVQHIVFPDGSFVAFITPLRDADSAVLHRSNAKLQLEALFGSNGEPVFAFGDPAYSEGGRILRTNRGEQ